MQCGKPGCRSEATGRAIHPDYIQYDLCRDCIAEIDYPEGLPTSSPGDIIVIGKDEQNDHRIMVDLAAGRRVSQTDQRTN